MKIKTKRKLFMGVLGVYMLCGWLYTFVNLTQKGEDR